MTLHRSAEDRARLSKLKAEIRILEKPNTEANRKLRKRLAKERAKSIGKPAEGQRQPRVRNNPYLAFLRRQCCIHPGCGRSPCDPAHIRWAPPGSGWRYVGKGEKPDDTRCVPLCREHHDLQHTMHERDYWGGVLGLDPVQTCADLYAAFLAGEPHPFAGKAER